MNIAKIYFNLIINKRKKLSDVPNSVRMTVETLLIEYYENKGLTFDEISDIIYT